MSGSKHAELIEAVEQGDVLRAQVLLDGGANPEACKVVTLKAKLKNNLVTDTVQAESVLALAIIHGNDRIVAALAEKGANVNASIFWKTSRYSIERTWKQRTWDTEHWMWSYQFRNALCLALGRAGRMFKWDRRTTMDAPINEGKLGINKHGASVILDSPQMPNDVRVWHQHTTSPAVIDALLSGGAEVTEEIRQCAETCGNLQVYEMICSHIRTTEPASDPPPYELRAADEPAAKPYSPPVHANTFSAQNRATEHLADTLAAAVLSPATLPTHCSTSQKGYNMSSHNDGTFPLSHLSRSSSSPPARYDTLPRNAINSAAPVDPLEPAGESSR
ncbi:hypothetical protein M427DRAFT_60264, partial [Gonapodya prolifera JEL478]